MRRRTGDGEMTAEEVVGLAALMACVTTGRSHPRPIEVSERYGVFRSGELLVTVGPWAVPMSRLGDCLASAEHHAGHPLRPRGNPRIWFGRVVAFWEVATAELPVTAPRRQAANATPTRVTAA